MDWNWITQSAKAVGLLVLVLFFSFAWLFPAHWKWFEDLWRTWKGKRPQSK
jgi:hypothetical protein